MNNQEDYKNFNPWPVLNRLSGALILVIGLFWLSRYDSVMAQTAKIIMILAGVVFSYAVRPVTRGYMDLPDKRQKRKKILLFVLALILIHVSAGLGMADLEPFSAGLAIHYLAGTLALFYAGRLMIRKTGQETQQSN